jgi:hypothetical protein
MYLKDHCGTRERREDGDPLHPGNWHGLHQEKASYHIDRYTTLWNQLRTPRQRQVSRATLTMPNNNIYFSHSNGHGGKLTWNALALGAVLLEANRTCSTEGKIDSCHHRSTFAFPTRQLTDAECVTAPNAPDFLRAPAGNLDSIRSGFF